MPFPIRVIDVMSSPVHTARPDTTASEAATRCIEEHISSLVVVEADNPVGIVHEYGPRSASRKRHGPTHTAAS